MNRSDLLKAIPASAISYQFKKPMAAFFKLPEDRKVIAFVNENVIPEDILPKSNCLWMCPSFRSAWRKARSLRTPSECTNFLTDRVAEEQRSHSAEL